ncbi:MAG: fatty acid desaturase [Deltaproteobacteria bacterium]|nr:fatty acid desaturase [Deltaproteobacteria bacterium]
MNFIEVDYPEPHRKRCQAILKVHPELRQFYGRDPQSALYIAGIVGFQILVATLLRNAAFPVILLTAWCVGAFANHSLWVLIHECAHNLLFPKKAHNQWWGFVANFPLVLPSSESFRIYHLKHHQYQGDYDLDPDMAGKWEAKLVGNSFVGKFLWELLFPLFHAVRVIRFSKKGGISFLNRWTVLNYLVQIAFDAAIILVLGPQAFLYLVCSFFFSIGLHPLGARWIQEHYTFFEGQETTSYYGPLNTVALNVGFHNEHHDFPFVPWRRLPGVKKAAPEFYDSLKSHSSWVALWFHFLTDPRMSLYSRITRKKEINAGRAALPKEDYAPGTFEEVVEGAIA